MVDAENFITMDGRLLAPVAVMQCGQIAQHTVAGGRLYLLRPPAACTALDTFPLLVLIHCYGCTPQ